MNLKKKTCITVQHVGSVQEGIENFRKTVEDGDVGKQ